MSLFVTAADDGWGGTVYNLTTAGFSVLVLIMLALVILGCSIFGKNKKFTAKQLAFSSMAIALAMVTSYIKLFKMPMGGSVTLFSMLFIVLIGYWYGVGTGLTTALAYGILQLVIDPYIISFPQMLVDYLFAFGALGLSGFMAGKKHGLVKGYILGVLGRYFFSFLSGWIFFGMYAPEEFPNAVVYSLAYNGAYLGTEAAITILVICIPPFAHGLAKVKEMANR